MRIIKIILIKMYNNTQVKTWIINRGVIPRVLLTSYGADRKIENEKCKDLNYTIKKVTGKPSINFACHCLISVYLQVMEINKSLKPEIFFSSLLFLLLYLYCIYIFIYTYINSQQKEQWQCLLPTKKILTTRAPPS